jgi:hypothetical protein
MIKMLHAVKGGLLSYCDKVYSRGNINQKHCIGGVMVSVLTLSAVDRRVKPKTIRLVFVASTLSTQHYGERGKIGWLGIRITCPNRVTFLPADCCFSELALYKSNSACWSRTRRTSSSSHW